MMVASLLFIRKQACPNHVISDNNLSLSEGYKPAPQPPSPCVGHEHHVLIVPIFGVKRQLWKSGGHALRRTFKTWSAALEGRFVNRPSIR